MPTITWRKLKSLLDEMDDDSLDFDVTILSTETEEVYPIISLEIITEDNEAYKDYSDVVDPGTPVIVI